MQRPREGPRLVQACRAIHFGPMSPADLAIRNCRRVLFVGLLATALSSPAFSQSQQTSQSPPSQHAPKSKTDPIASALRANDFSQAIDLSRAALKEYPQDPQLWSMQGFALASSGKGNEALAAFQQALKISPNHIMALQGAAQLQFQAGSREAAPLLNRLLKLRPDDPISHAMLGVAQYREGNCASAVPHFAKAGSVLDSQPPALHAYALCLVRLRKLNDAVNVFQRTVSLSSGDPQERRLLAAVQVMARQPK